MGYIMNIIKHRFIAVLIFCFIALLMIQYSSSQKENNMKVINNDQLTGGDTDEMPDSDSELTDMESDNNYAYVENDDTKLFGNDMEQKELLELEKEKQKLELENNETVSQVNEDKSEDSLKGLGLCNQQQNYEGGDNDGSLLNSTSCNSDYYTLSNDYLSSTKDKIKPNELLPAAAVDMKGENFLNATLSQSTEQFVGKPSQVNRSRKNYDLRSTPPNPQVEVSPRNMSTIEPDSNR